MGRKKSEETSGVEARVLCDFVHDGETHKAGSIFTGDAETVKGLAAGGVVDPHPEAVKAAKDGG